MPIDAKNSILMYDLGRDGLGASEFDAKGPRTRIVALPPRLAGYLDEVVAYLRERSDAYDAQQGPALRVVKGGAS